MDGRDLPVIYLMRGMPLQTGEYIIGDYIINITTDGGITVEITDIITGDTTIVQVPYY